MDSKQSSATLRRALLLIKKHITTAETQQNWDLHAAVQLIVDAARGVGLLSLPLDWDILPSDLEHLPVAHGENSE
jgi:hypothetical protein